MREKLDLTTLSDALESFNKALDEYEKDKSNDFVRDSCIQRFEYCYDLSAKMIRRHLSMTSENLSEISEMSFQNLIRKAYGMGVLKNSWDTWWEYRDNRNLTSHGYSEKKALQIVKNLPAFYQEIVFLLQALKKSNQINLK